MTDNREQISETGKSRSDRMDTVMSEPRQNQTGRHTNGNEGCETEIGGRRFANTQRVASILGVSTRTLSRWGTAGTGPPKIKLGRKALFDLCKLSDWLASRETQTCKTKI
jgi:predicted DNA-binding transcriptional regulator AlpA